MTFEKSHNGEINYDIVFLSIYRTMRKILFTILLLMFACYNIQAKKQFVEMEFHKNCIKLNDGTNKKTQTLKDASGKEIKFLSLIGALNYMSLQGWELVDTKSIISGQGYAGYSQTGTNIYYIFCKDVSDEELQQVVEDSYKE